MSWPNVIEITLSKKTGETVSLWHDGVEQKPEVRRDPSKTGKAAKEAVIKVLSIFGYYCDELDTTKKGEYALRFTHNITTG